MDADIDAFDVGGIDSRNRLNHRAGTNCQEVARMNGKSEPAIFSRALDGTRASHGAFTISRSLRSLAGGRT